jgi:PAS domain S-box-containing protein
VSSDATSKTPDIESGESGSRSGSVAEAFGVDSPRPLACDPEYRSLVLAAAPVAVIAVDVGGVITLVERSGLRSRDQDLAGLIGKSVFQVHQGDPALVRHWKRALAGDRFLVVTRQGGVEFETRFGPILDAAGGRIGAVAVWLPIPERERAVAALQESEVRFRALTEQASDVIAEVEADGNFLYVSPRFTDLLGYSEEEIIGQSAVALVHPDDLARVQRLHREARGSRSSCCAGSAAATGAGDGWRWWGGCSAPPLASFAGCWWRGT